MARLGPRPRPRPRPRPIATINQPGGTFRPIASGLGTPRPPAAPAIPAIPNPAAAVPPPAIPAVAAPAPFTGDAQYLAEQAQREFARQNQLTQLDTQGSYEAQDLQEAVRRMLEQRGQAVQQTRQTANKQGLFYSGQLGKRLGLVQTDSARRQADAQLAFDRRQAARDAARRAIEAGAPLEEAAGIAAAADRQIARDQAAADTGALAAPAAPASTPAPAAKTVAAPKATRQTRQPTTSRRRPRRPQR